METKKRTAPRVIYRVEKFSDNWHKVTIRRYARNKKTAFAIKKEVGVNHCFVEKVHRNDWGWIDYRWLEG